jgi:hypothetical protein
MNNRTANLILLNSRDEVLLQLRDDTPRSLIRIPGACRVAISKAKNHPKSASSVKCRRKWGSAWRM